jgi:hypothetical protein
VSQEQEWVPERDELPAVLDVHKAALQEIDRIVGNEDELGSEDCAKLRRIISSALSGRHRKGAA